MGWSIQESESGVKHWRRELTKAIAGVRRWSKAPRAYAADSCRSWVRHCVKQIRYWRDARTHAYTEAAVTLPRR